MCTLRPELGLEITQWPSSSHLQGVSFSIQCYHHRGVHAVGGARIGVVDSEMSVSCAFHT